MLCGGAQKKIKCFLSKNFFFFILINNFATGKGPGKALFYAFIPFCAETVLFLNFRSHFLPLPKAADEMAEMN